MYFIYIKLNQGGKKIKTHCTDKSSAIKLLKQTAIQFIKDEEGDKRASDCIIKDDIDSCREGYLLQGDCLINDIRTFKIKSPPKIRLLRKNMQYLGILRGWQPVCQVIGYFSIIYYHCDLIQQNTVNDLHKKIRILEHRTQADNYPVSPPLIPQVRAFDSVINELIQSDKFKAMQIRNP